MRIFKKAAFVALAVTPLLIAGTNANAAGVGAAGFAGFVTLDVFPCAGGPGCTATFSATVAAGAGISDGPAVAVVTTLSADVQYSEICTAGEALDGTATGTAHLGGTNVVGSLLPLDAPFKWTRVGLVAVIQPNGSPSVAGAAVFAPTSGPPACTGGSVTAVVAGAAVLVQ